MSTGMPQEPLSPGKIRGLSQCATPEGIFTILAIDHRDSLRVELDPHDPSSISPGRLTEVKLGLLRDLVADASGVMLDPQYSIAQALCSRTLPGSVGYLAAVEAQGYLGDPTSAQTSLLDGWSVAKAKRAGASGIKLLVLCRPEDGAVTEAQDEVVAAVVTECAREEIPLFLEPLVRTGGNDGAGNPRSRRDEVVGAVRRLGALGPDVLKVQFPVDTQRESDRRVWEDACAELDDASPVPWALLSGGDPYPLFLEQVEVAARAGASGFMVGRALWRDVIAAAPHDRVRVIDDVVRPRLRELASTARTYATDWADRHTMPHVDERWYLRY